jgi:mono/diheme cytochrome c family protein
VDKPVDKPVQRILTLVATLILGTVIASAQPPAPDASRGKELYDKKYLCSACHGFSGQNGVGARLVPMKLTQAAFMAYVRHPHDTPTGMPPYTAKVLPDQELADIYAYIKLLPDSAKKAKDIPILNDILNSQK